MENQQSAGGPGGWREEERCSIATRETVTEAAEKRNPEEAEMRKRRKRKKGSEAQEESMGITTIDQIE